MALSMEEQRILAQIERQLAEEDPRLAERLSRPPARRPFGHRRRRPRLRVRLLAAVAVAVVGLVTAVAAAVITAVS